MILENSNGQKREFEILLEFESNNKKYIIYKDLLSDNVYGGRMSRNKLKALDEDEYRMLNNILEKFNN